MPARRVRRTFTAASIALALAACGSAPRDASGPMDDPLAVERFTALASAAARGPLASDPQRLVITTPAAWQEFWTQRFAWQQPAPPLPEIDFSREMIVAVTAGLKPSGGFAIAVQSVVDRGSELEVTVRETAPGQACIVTGALTHPYDVVRLPRASRPVRFVERKSVNNCG